MATTVTSNTARTAWVRSMILAALTAGGLAASASAAPTTAPTGRPGSAAARASAATPAGPAQERGYTRPSNQSDLSFPGPGVVKDVLVKAGDVVEANKTIIARQDDSAEQAQYAANTGEMLSAELQVTVSKVKLDKSRVDLRRVEELYKDIVKAGETNAEIDEARVQVKVDEVTVQFHQHQIKQKELERALTDVKIKQKVLLAPISGVVAKVDLHPGEGTDLTRPAGIQVVQNNPLWVEAQMASTKADALRVGQPLEVKYVDGGEWMPAKVIFLSPVGSAGANVRLVRLELDNAAGRESGLQVAVRVPDNVAAAPLGR